MTASAPTDEPIEPFGCPRCGDTVTERFWGPCSACRAQLTATFGQAGGGEPAMKTSRFEPAMHVTPNHVATKD